MLFLIRMVPVPDAVHTGYCSTSTGTYGTGSISSYKQNGGGSCFRAAKSVDLLAEHCVSHI
jgi:hypothetical protein